MHTRSDRHALHLRSHQYWPATCSHTRLIVQLKVLCIPSKSLQSVCVLQISELAPCHVSRYVRRMSRQRTKSTPVYVPVSLALGLIKSRAGLSALYTVY